MKSQAADLRPRIVLFVTLLLSLSLNGRNVHGQDVETEIQWLLKNGGEIGFEGDGPDKRIVSVRLDGAKGILGSQIKEEFLSKLVKVLPDLRELSLINHFSAPELRMEHIVQLKKLRSLNLSSTVVYDNLLEKLTDLPCLEDLSLNYSGIDDDALKYILPLKNLKRLEIDGSSISSRSNGEVSWEQFVQTYFELRKHGHPVDPEFVRTKRGISSLGIARLVGLRELQHLSIAGTRIDNQGLELLSQFPKLTSLDLSCTSITDDGLVAISRLSELKSLRINFCLLSDDGLKSIGKLIKLEELQLCYAAVTDEGMKQLKNCGALRTLNVSQTKITDDSIDVLQKFSQLENLHAVGSRISLFGMFELCKKLPRMELKSIIKDFGLILEWSPSPNKESGEETLTALRMNSNSNVNDETLSTLRDHGFLADLETLDLRGTSITDKGLRYLRDSKKLRWLELEGTSVTDAGLGNLQNLSELDYFPIRDSKLTLRGTIHLIVTLQGRPIEDAFHVARLHLDSGNELFQKALDLRDLRVTDDDLKLLANASEFDTLLLQGNPISDDGMSYLAGIPLRHLSVSGHGISGKGIAKLKHIKSLETLWLDDTALTEADLDMLASMPQIATLNLSGVTFTKSGIDQLKQLKKIETLIVDSSAISTADIKELQANNPDLAIIRSQKRALAAIRKRERTSLHLPQGWHRVLEYAGVNSEVMDHPLVSVFGDAHFEQAIQLTYDSRFLSSPSHWKYLPTLQSVSINGVKKPVTAIAVLKEIPALTEVSLFGSPITDSDLREMGDLPLVKNLVLGDTNLTDACLQYVARLPQLESLTLGGYSTNVRDEGLHHLAKAVHLKNLDLSRTLITDAGMSHLEGLKQLESLSLREVRIDSGLRYLASLKNLEQLDLYHTSVSDESLSYLYELENLRTIDLSGTLVSESGAQRLGKRLADAFVSIGSIAEEARERARPFGKLGIPMNRDSNDEVTMLDFRRPKHFVETLPLVQELKYLEGLGIGDEATDEILQRVAEFSRLQTLALRECSVTAQGLLSLRALPNLKHLYLARMDLSSDALACLGDFSQLEGLALNGTNIGDTDLIFLGKTPQLKRLYLDGTGVTKACLEHLEKLIHLEYLSLVKTNINPEDVKEFEQTHPTCKVVFGK